MNTEYQAWVDPAANLLHLDGHTYPCDRDIVALALWQECALLLSADTDCLALWDRDGLVRTVRVGVYPQDFAMLEDRAYVCGSADGRLHVLTLPDLHTIRTYPLPGLPERVLARGNNAWVLSFMPEPQVHTQLLQLDLHSGQCQAITSYAGLPGALAADDRGLWIGVSELVAHLPWGAATADLLIEGIGLASKIVVRDEGVIITDSLENRRFFVRT